METELEKGKERRREICTVTAERYSRLRNLFNSTRTELVLCRGKTDSFSDVMTGSSNKGIKQKQQQQQVEVHTDTRAGRKPQVMWVKYTYLTTQFKTDRAHRQ